LLDLLIALVKQTPNHHPKTKASN